MQSIAATIPTNGRGGGRHERGHRHRHSGDSGPAAPPQGLDEGRPVGGLGRVAHEELLVAVEME